VATAALSGNAAAADAVAAGACASAFFNRFAAPAFCAILEIFWNTSATTGAGMAGS
jgi:hypothetical protein